MKKLLVSLLAIAGLVACTNDEVVNVQKGNPITFDSFVENATRANDPSTTTNSLNAFRAWAFMDEVSGEVLKNELVEKVGSVWSYVNTQYWMPDHTYYFAALAPVEGNWTLDTAGANTYGAGKVTFTNVNGSEDLLYAATAVESQEKDNLPVKFQFSHLLSKINFTFVNGFATSNVDVEVKNVTMTAPASASINLAVENWWDNNDWVNLADGLTLEFGDVVRLDAGDSATATDERLTIPASAEREYKVEFDIVVYSGEVPSNFHKTATIKGVAFEMGKAYNLTATISPESLDLEAIEFEVAVNEWEQAGNDVSVSELQAAAILGGEYTLTENLELTTPLEVAAPFTLNLNDNTLTGAIELAEGVELTINDGTIVNGDKSVSGITSNGELTLNNVNIESARHAVRVESGKVYIYGGEYKVKPDSKSTLHALNVGDDNTTAEVYIYGGTFIGPKGTESDSGSAVNVRNGSSVVIEGGNFSGGKSKTLSGVNITVKGGTFDQNPSNFLATGYKAIVADGLYYVLPEIIADAAETAGVTSVTESTADVATALATDNGEATMFMWNDVAYIAKYGEVVITSAAAEATTVRNVVEYSTGLKRATVADGIEVVGNRTFRRCANLETVALPNTLTEIGPAVFQSCSKLANITIPESVTTIGEGAFAECTALTSINIPYGVTRIEADALRATGLVSVEFHEGVTYFGAQAFRDCKQLKEVIINAPEFTVEANAFGVMSGALPGTTIYVANAEMKAYLESTLAYKNQFTIVAPQVVASTDDLKAALKTDAKMVSVAKGEYTFPTSSVKDGQTIICEEGTVFTGKSSLDINGATVIGAEFKNENDNAVSGTINGTFKNCTFTGSNALRGCYAGETVVFENCVFDGDVYGAHFDGG